MSSEPDILIITAEEIEVVEVISTGPQGPPGPGGVVLTWSGSDYVPVSQKAASVPKEFRGPVDPRNVPGVVINTYDVWVQTS